MKNTTACTKTLKIKFLSTGKPLSPHKAVGRLLLLRVRIAGGEARPRSLLRRNGPAHDKGHQGCHTQYPGILMCLDLWFIDDEWCKDECDSLVLFVLSVYSFRKCLDEGKFLDLFSIL